MAVEQHAELIDAVDDLVLVEDLPGLLTLPGVAGHLVQGQHGVVAGVIGVVAGRPVHGLATVAHGEVVGNRDRLVGVTRKPCWDCAVGVHERTLVPAPGCAR